MTDDHLNQLADLIEAAHFAPDDDAYLAIAVDSLLALREGQEKQTALLEAQVESQRQMLQLATATLDQEKQKLVSRSQRVRQKKKNAATSMHARNASGGNGNTARTDQLNSWLNQEVARPSMNLYMLALPRFSE